MRTWIHGRRATRVLVAAAVTALLGTAVAVASELFTDATLSSNVNAPTSVDAGEATAFEIKIWVTGNVQNQAGKGDVDIVTKYTMNSSGVITPSTSPGDIVRKTFSPGQYSGGGSICGGTTQPVGCQANPIVVNATLSVASGAAAGTDGTLQVDAIAPDGSGVQVGTSSEDIGYVEVSGPTDATAPNAASISIDDGAAWTNSTGVTVDLAADDAVGITRYRLAATQAGLGSAADVAVNPAQPSFTATDVAYTLASGDGTKTAWARFCDAANNCTDVSDTIGLDTVKPTITGQRAPAANSNGWNSSDVTVSFACADNTGGSGVDTDTVAGATVSTEGANQSVTNTGTCTDEAGNVADSATVSNINIDKTDPSVAITSPAPGTTTIASSITVSGTDSDTPSGISGVTVDGVAATLGTGTFSRSGVALACGSNTITAVATDLAGRTASSSITVNRACFGIQYLQPLDQSTTTPVMNQGKYGRVIPVKVLLSRQGGGGLTQADLTANGWTLQIGVNGATCSSGVAADALEAYADAGLSNSGTNLFRYDATGANWIYNLDTKAPPSMTMAVGKCYRLDAYISDGTTKVLVSSTTYALFQPVK